MVPAAFDANTTNFIASGTSPLTNTTLTVGSGANRCLVAQLTSYQDTSSGMAVTWNGVSMTLIGSTDNGSNSHIYLFGLVNPASGSHTLSASWTGTANSVAINGTSFTGCNQTGGTTTFTGYATSLGSTLPAGGTVTSASGNGAIAICVASTFCTTSSGTELFVDTANTGGGAIYSVATNPTLSFSTSGSWVYGSISIAHN